MKKVLIALGILVLVAGIFFWFYFPTLTRYRELRTEQEGIEEKIQELDQKIKELESERNLLQHDREYIEKVIRDELGLVKPGEVVYKFVKDKKPQEPSVPVAGSSAPEAAVLNPAKSAPQG